MPSPGRLCRALVIFLVLLSGCTFKVVPGVPDRAVSQCHVIYDAGSKRTRLYVYEQSATGWMKHSGPKTSALADPVRAIRGKTMADADTVVAEIVASLEDLRHAGPVDKKGKPEWSAFDWRERCSIEAVSVYATAGMRIAEHQDAAASEVLWKKLNEKLSAAVGMQVSTRTLSGYEEGLFSWLAIREKQVDDSYGVAEMGGASIQVTFPCAQCEASRWVKVKGRVVPVYSYSFLGWGQDEAWEKMGSLPACARAAGLENPDWKVADCSAGMTGFSGAAAEVGKYIRTTKDLRWYLSDAFRYMQDDDIDQFCRKGMDSGHEPVSACFRAVYLQNVLSTLGLPEDSEPSGVDWTLGAVVCSATRCLEIQ